ncbi:T9SS type A sorting domain-containing protein [Microbacter margulisiae]|uniref:Por secretion system C-terminal sorting domain-containing protein n=1 Tax=Microbacter margulisiae TaxID=1350067 RepID=A0A7W5DPK8_9PORP|nr:T9SS type A sorting domain-containing protein [Microbacter margulisiae]MBB3186686.1 hypothetical protein [Microbacter margulisiae]
MKQSLLYISFILTLFITTNLQAQNQRQNSMSISASQRMTVVVNEDHVMTVTNAPANSILEIFSLVGTKVAEKRVVYNHQEFALDLPVGYYIVRIGDQTQKIVIR